ncbi:f-box [Fusarium phyllophilum]|uniref:F-box n=1 Tax=Fusarium phyllophilum TaxID=47803 RepID=A0A8H5K0H0_9HYPO|nr:f-box [Fusarium phyllophilum]
MTSNTNELDSELESFRQKWISDLRTRTEHPETAEAPAGPSRRPHHGPISSLPHKHVPAPADDGDDDYVQSRAFDQDEPVAQAPQDVHHDRKGKKLVSALDHFEEAMHKEGQGNMGDSLKLYRKAYRLDNGVDRRYREKHFPQKTAPRPVSPTATKASAPEASQPPKPEEVVEAKPLPIGELIASFSGLKIEPAPPPIEGMPEPPCPMADLPDEILIHILRDVAIADVGDFARLSRVCKRLAYLVASEQRIWRRVALGSEVGFSSQIYRFEKGIEWDDLPEEEQEVPEIQDGFVISPSELAQRRRDANIAFTESLIPSVYPTWKQLLRSRPRIRFNGCYISTVNYVRTGQASTNQPTWGSPIHIVTYYRYLRFFRDGTLISLLSTAEPADVVHHMTREELNVHRGVAQPHLPSAVMALALRGRWRLSTAADRDEGSDTDRPGPATGKHDRDRDPEGDVFIETEGVGSKYMYRMDLSMRSAGKGSRNNKLIRRGFYSYNKLTDDWGEFGLKNDKPFFFSRVKSYGFWE